MILPAAKWPCYRLSRYQYGNMWSCSIFIFSQNWGNPSSGFGVSSCFRCVHNIHKKVIICLLQNTQPMTTDLDCKYFNRKSCYWIVMGLHLYNVYIICIYNKMLVRIPQTLICTLCCTCTQLNYSLQSMLTR